MKNAELNNYAGRYKDELLNNVIPFWLEHSKDTKFGGYYSCLDRFGNVFDTDKFLWLQGREVWMFSMLYNEMEQRPEWLEMAIHGAEFLKRHGRDAEGNWYFSLDRQGNPLVQPYNIFSDCFAAMAFGELYKATKNEEYKKIAVDTYNNIIKRKDDPKGIYNKLYPGTRPLKSFALPMILCNLSLILEDIVGSKKIDEIVPPLIDDILNNFYQKDTGVILENIHPDGSVVDCFEGRLVNPGHTNEAMWFLMDLAVRYNDKKLINKAIEILLHSIEFGWDKEFGGIFYFMDVKGHPQQQLEWDQKLWWVHLETLIALAKGYKLTGNQECKMWFETVQAYTWEHFKDKEYREWYGYLNRQGQPLLPLKGGKWKGCFHVPRAMFQLNKILSQE